MSFLSEYELYATEVSYNNKEFTPKQLEDYFEQTEKQNFGKPEKIKKLVTESRKIFMSVMDKHGLTLDQVLQADTSSGGKALANLTLLHCDMCWLLNSNYKDFDELLKVYSCWENKL